MRSLIRRRQLVADIDWELIAANPKVFCGFSDITALQNAMLACSRLVTYSGPHWSTFGMCDRFEQTLAWFCAAVFDEAPITIEPAATWTDDEWFIDQNAPTRAPTTAGGHCEPGTQEGRIVGGNLCTLMRLAGVRVSRWATSTRLVVGRETAASPGSGDPVLAHFRANDRKQAAPHTHRAPRGEHGSNGQGLPRRAMQSRNQASAGPTRDAWFTTHSAVLPRADYCMAGDDAQAEPLEMTSGPVCVARGGKRVPATLRYGRWAMRRCQGPGHW
jgi:LD-carboxypeptidase N-terminal domain